MFFSIVDMNNSRTVCLLCESRFEKAQLPEHVLSHLASASLSFKCDSCECKGYTELDMIRHKDETGHPVYIILVNCVYFYNNELVFNL